MENLSPKIRLRIWLESEAGVFFGDGRAELLSRVAELGSLRAAAMSLGMSYRAAWGKIKRTEAVIGKEIIAKTGGNREGYSLTPFGRDLLTRFNSFHAAVIAEAERLGREILRFGGPPKA